VRLLEPIALGGRTLANRVVLAPMTRNRAVGQVQSAWAVEHYAARASAGLILSEATQVSARGQSTADTPGLHTQDQASAWKAVTDAVHAAGGTIAAQLAHAGRLTHSDYHGQLPAAPSALRPAGVIRTPLGTKEYEVPEELSAAGIAAVVDEFAASARWARVAGFDGVEIHGAHGFLIDQFLQSKTNQRTDSWGGSAQGRRRFALEVLEAVRGVWPRDQIGMTISPAGTHKGIGDEDPVGTFTDLTRALSDAGLGWLHIADIPWGDQRPSEVLRPLFFGPVIVSEGYTRDTAEEALQAGYADLVAFGRAFTANPDLVERFRTGARLNLADPKTFYAGGRAGYLES
jgi:N-ethylmaleimide reductase